jgi:UDP-N-acetylglucosamine 2-epimerase (non-hydrolysing)
VLMNDVTMGQTMIRRVLCVVGTRPEAIKMAPVIRALKGDPRFECRVLATGQHREMLRQALEIFDIKPDIELDMMRPNQTLSSLTSRLIDELDGVLVRESPDCVLGQGDTTTVLCAALASFYRRIPFGHVEAGLRTGDFYNPFPEEMNRVLAGHLSRWHFAPTETSQLNLLREGIPSNRIWVTGNTVIDALMMVEGATDDLRPNVAPGKRLLLVTAHRRENFGEPFKNILVALRRLVEMRSDIEILYPVHPNPNVKEPALAALSGLPSVHLVSPLDYLPFVAAMRTCYLIISDSGGIQEEAPALGKPVLVLRNETERPEAVMQGVVQLVGCDPDLIVSSTLRLLDDPQAYSAMARGISPYGDGKAASRILDVLANS